MLLLVMTCMLDGEWEWDGSWTFGVGLWIWMEDGIVGIGMDDGIC
jgi:hypothetical protein